MITIWAPLASYQALLKGTHILIAWRKKALPILHTPPTRMPPTSHRWANLRKTSYIYLKVTWVIQANPTRSLPPMSINISTWHTRQIWWKMKRPASTQLGHPVLLHYPSRLRRIYIYTIHQKNTGGLYQKDIVPWTHTKQDETASCNLRVTTVLYTQQTRNNRIPKSPCSHISHPTFHS